jgi:DinB superfamily
MANSDPLRIHLVNLLRMEGAHADFDSAVDGFPPKLRGKKIPGAPHTAWQLLEHLRIAQEDILDFSRNPTYKEKKWPEEYWPEAEAPPDDAAWDASVAQFRKDLKAMEKLISDASVDLMARIPHGTGQTILREALLVADHNAYHVGQLMFVRRTLEG